jgi:hypothetical protein
MTMELVRYDAMCRAIAEAYQVDEVKDIRDKAEALRVYAHQAKNRQLEIDAAEIRMRAERRLGECIRVQKETVGLGKTGPKLPSEKEGNSRVSLSDAGIDHKLSHRAQKLAAVPEEQFERSIGQWRDRLESENERITADLLKAADKEQRKAERQENLPEDSCRLSDLAALAKRR